MLELYMLKECPYCKKVVNYMDTHNLEYKKIDISDRENAESLRRIGGKEQVPFLIDKERGIEMYESDDILEYLKTL